MKELFGRLTRKLLWLFDFRQPRFRHLQCVDLVLESKLLLLVSWDTMHTSKIRIRPGRVTCRLSTSAVICKLPVSVNSVDIILSNCWQSKKITFPLKRIAVDEQTIKYLNTQLLNKISYKNIKAQFTDSRIHLANAQPTIGFTVPMPEFNILINHLQLNDHAS